MSYAAETVTTEYLTAVFCTIFAVVAGTVSKIAGVIIGGIVALFSSAVDDDSSDDETKKFQEYARGITNDNSKWILGEAMNYKTIEVPLYDPMHLNGTNKITYALYDSQYLYGYDFARGTFSNEFAEKQ